MIPLAGNNGDRNPGNGGKPLPESGEGGPGGQPDPPKRPLLSEERLLQEGAWLLQRAGIAVFFLASLFGLLFLLAANIFDLNIDDWVRLRSLELFAMVAAVGIVVAIISRSDNAFVSVLGFLLIGALIVPTKDMVSLALLASGQDAPEDENDRRFEDGSEFKGRDAALANQVIAALQNTRREHADGSDQARLASAENTSSDNTSSDTTVLSPMSPNERKRAERAVARAVAEHRRVGHLDRARLNGQIDLLLSFRPRGVNADDYVRECNLLGGQFDPEASTKEKPADATIELIRNALKGRGFGVVADEDNTESNEMRRFANISEGFQEYYFRHGREENFLPDLVSLRRQELIQFTYEDFSEAELTRLGKEVVCDYFEKVEGNLWYCPHDCVVAERLLTELELDADAGGIPTLPNLEEIEERAIDICEGEVADQVSWEDVFKTSNGDSTLTQTVPFILQLPLDNLPDELEDGFFVGLSSTDAQDGGRFFDGGDPTLVMLGRTSGDTTECDVVAVNDDYRFSDLDSRIYPLEFHSSSDAVDEFVIVGQDRSNDSGIAMQISIEAGESRSNRSSLGALPPNGSVFTMSDFLDDDTGCPTDRAPLDLLESEPVETPVTFDTAGAGAGAGIAFEFEAPSIEPESAVYHITVAGNDGRNVDPIVYLYRVSTDEQCFEVDSDDDSLGNFGSLLHVEDPGLYYLLVGNLRGSDGATEMKIERVQLQ